MNQNKNSVPGLMRPSDAFLPMAHCAAALLGRNAVSLYLFAATYAVKACGLASSNGLRGVFALQPSMRYVQGSAAVSLLLQLVGAVVAALIARIMGQNPTLYPLIISGLLLNIDHVFYEYLFAVGDGHSASLCRGITALLTLAGLLLCAPATPGYKLPDGMEPAWPLVTTGLSALVGFVISVALGGRLRPKLNTEVLRQAPLALLQTLLYPALALTTLIWLKLPDAAFSLFAGLAIYELCRTPFRRSPQESKGMNRALLTLCIVATICISIQYFVLTNALSEMISATCCAVILASICALAMFGNVKWKENP